MSRKKLSDVALLAQVVEDEAISTDEQVEALLIPELYANSKHEPAQEESSDE